MNRKLSPLDRNYRNNKKIEIILRSNNEYNLHGHINTIRSKTLKDLCYFMLITKKDPTILYKRSPKELAELTGFSERKVYDLLKVIHLIINQSEVSFETGKNNNA